MAAQFTSTNGAPARGLFAWSHRATSSLPVPFSPVISTRASHGATLSMSCRTCSILGEKPMIRSACTGCARRLRCAEEGAVGDDSCAGGSNTRCRVCNSRFMSTGLVRKSCAPLRTASTAVSIDRSDESTMKGISGSGIRHSVSEMITSKGIFPHRVPASVSSPAVSAENPSYSNRSRNTFRTLFDRSRIKTFAITCFS